MTIVDCLIEFVGPAPAPGVPAVFKGLDTAEPVMELEDGSVYVGEFVEIFGTLMVFSQDEDRVDLESAVGDKKLVLRKKTGSTKRE